MQNMIIASLVTMIFGASTQSALAASATSAAVQTKTIEYKQGDQVLEGYIAYPEKVKKAPGIVVVHDWMGLQPGESDYAKTRARQLAEMGYVALAADIYGKGQRPADQKQAAEFAGKYKSDRALLRARVKAALDTLEKDPHVDTHQIAAIGYCFGGTTVLELARSGADIAGVVSFHGGLDTPHPETSKLKAKVLALHGADDPFVPADQVAAFQDELRKAKADWQMIYYADAVHSFTKPSAGNDPSKGQAYNEKADKRSWQAMKQFFAEIFKK
jgi:dienelactone hydrolase